MGKVVAVVADKLQSKSVEERLHCGCKLCGIEALYEVENSKDRYSCNLLSYGSFLHVAFSEFFGNRKNTKYHVATHSVARQHWGVPSHPCWTLSSHDDRANR